MRSSGGVACNTLQCLIYNDIRLFLFEYNFLLYFMFVIIVAIEENNSVKYFWVIIIV